MSASGSAQKIIATVLGCSSSAGVPRIGGLWGDCDPKNPKNRRRRCSLLLTGTRDDSAGKTQILIDTGCDLREQLLSVGVGHIDAAFYTHEHADHTHGIDDLRALAMNAQRRVDVYFSQPTCDRLKEAFAYCFRTPARSSYPPILNEHIIAASDATTIEGPGGSITLTAFEQDHGDIQSLGFRVGDFAYSCDLSGIPDRALAHVTGLKVWILDALRRKPHPTHLSLDDALGWVEKMQPTEAVLTNLHIDLDYDVLNAETPKNVQPAFDGMQIDVLAGKILNA